MGLCTGAPYCMRHEGARVVICSHIPCSTITVQMLIITSVDDEAELIPHHEDTPRYVPLLKLLIIMGHFVIISYLNALGIKEQL
jgi:hypothetical protein